MENSVRELAYKLWQIRSLRNTRNTPEDNWYDAENILQNKYLRPGIKILYGGEQYEFVRVEERTVILSSGEEEISAPIDEVVVVDEVVGG